MSYISFFYHFIIIYVIDVRKCRIRKFRNEELSGYRPWTRGSPCGLPNSLKRAGNPMQYFLLFSIQSIETILQLHLRFFKKKKKSKKTQKTG